MQPSTSFRALAHGTGIAPPATVRLASLLPLLLLGCDPGAAAIDAAPAAADAAPVGQGGPPRADLAINEVAPSPASGADWLELSDHGATDADLSGWFVTDDPDRLDHYYQFPAGTSLPAGGRLIVWADEGATGDGHHAPFKLSRSDGVYLVKPSGVVADGLLYLLADGHLALARVPDGEGLFYPVTPSPGLPNPQVLP